MDILYVLGKESVYDNLELRLSLRSVEKYVKNVDRVFVVGEKPDWLQNVIHLKSNDIYTKETNIFDAVMIACKNGISPVFLFMNDDFFISGEIDAESYPYYTNGYMRFIENPSRYQQVQNKTLLAFETLYKDEPVYNCELHCPMRFSRSKFLSLRQYLESSKKEDIGYFFRTLYANIFVSHYDWTTDCKLWSNDKIWFPPHNCISTNDECDAIMEELKKMYPDKSKYET